MAKRRADSERERDSKRVRSGRALPAEHSHWRCSTSSASELRWRVGQQGRRDSSRFAVRRVLLLLLLPLNGGTGRCVAWVLWQRASQMAVSPSGREVDLVRRESIRIVTSESIWLGENRFGSSPGIDATYRRESLPIQI